MQLKSKYKHFSGTTEYYQHDSQVNHAPMRFAVFLPEQINHKKLPVLYWLSGLTCTEENFMVKAGAQRVAAKLGIVLVTMDTSPRNLGIEGEDDSYDFGSGAGFYLNATEQSWSMHYNMYDYVTKELPGIIENNFNVTNCKSISGHSMGGHGALMIALKNPGKYQSVSAFSPIVAPSQCLWGQKAFAGYLGADKTAWQAYDSCELLKVAEQRLPLLIDQGTDDEFLEQYLMPEKLQIVCEKYKHPLNLRMQKSYDHSYYFIATFIEDHLYYHAKYLNV
ncbi:MAG: S-formylglutathione hydrolase [Alcanivoracaceae bacterium]|nr:S-formylglutathione hydrolase [Alcanivoracaceae bacterium]